MTDYHEPTDELTPEVRDCTRALHSLKEEVEAVDWYNQRVAACSDPELRKILAHNRDEEIEHACMTLEWLRRKMPGWNEELSTYLFTTGDITALEEGEENEGGQEEDGKQPVNPGGGLGIGKI